MNDSAKSSLATDDHGANDSAESCLVSGDEAANDSAESSLVRDGCAADDSAESSSATDHVANDSAIDATIDSAESSPTARRRKKVSGDTQRVLIQLAPHLLSDGLVATLDDGTWIAPETWRRFACDCALELVKVDQEGTVLDVGRRTRTIPPALARALDVRDAGRCRFPGCNHRRFLDRHHLEHWSRGGETKLDNLVTLCTALTTSSTRAAGRWSSRKATHASSDRTERRTCARSRRAWRTRCAFSRRSTPSSRSGPPRG